MKRLAMLTCRDQTGYVIDDDLVREPLLKKNIAFETVPWDVPTKWETFDAVIIRSTWDYTSHLDLFLTTLKSIEVTGVPLFNPFKIIEWNCRKNYLQNLQKKGVSIIHTHFATTLENQDLNTWSGFFELWNTDQIIVKPTVGANSIDTYWIKKSQLPSFLASPPKAQDEAAQKDPRKSWMIQPFIPSVLSQGEVSCHFFWGEFSHAILKTPKPNDFRVQEEHGGIIRPFEPEPSLLQAAQKAIAAIECPLLYARVDLVQDRSGEWLLMELELIEPALYLRMDPQAKVQCKLQAKSCSASTFAFCSW